MKVKPSHIVRAPDAAGRKACSRRKAKAPMAGGGDAAAGFFLQLVVQHNWPPACASAWPVMRSSLPQAEAARSNRAAHVGHGAFDLGLPGAAEHIKRWRLQSAVRP